MAVDKGHQSVNIGSKGAGGTNVGWMVGACKMLITTIGIIMVVLTIEKRFG